MHGEYKVLEPDLIPIMGEKDLSVPLRPCCFYTKGY